MEWRRTPRIADGAVTLEKLRPPLQAAFGAMSAPPIRVLLTGEEADYAADPGYGWIDGTQGVTAKMGSKGRTAQSVDGAAAYARYQFEEVFNINGAIGFWIHVDDPAKLAELWLYRYATVEGGTSSYVLLFRRSTGNYQGLPSADGWWLYVAGTSDWKTVDPGNPCGRIGIKVVSEAAQTVNVTIGGIYEEQFPFAGIVLGWDGAYYDGTDNGHDVLNHQIYAEMVARQWPGVHYTAAVSIGTTNRCSQATMDLLYAAGWDVVHHGTGEVVTMTDLTELEFRQYTWRARNALTAMGYTRGSCVASWYQNMGRANVSPENIVPWMASLGFLASRSLVSWEEHYFLQASGYAPMTSINGAWLLPDFFNLPSRSCGSGTIATQLAALQQIVDGGGMQFWYHHKVEDCADGDQGGVNISSERWNAIWAAIADYVADGTLRVLTLTEYLAMIRARPGAWRVTADGAIVWADDPDTLAY